MECECVSQPLQQPVLFRTKPQHPVNQRLPGRGESQLCCRDVTNIEVSSNSMVDHRACKYKAVEIWQDQIKSSKQRGDPAAGPPARNAKN